MLARGRERCKRVVKGSKLKKSRWVNKLGKRVGATVVGNIWHAAALALCRAAVRYHKT